MWKYALILAACLPMVSEAQNQPEPKVEKPVAPNRDKPLPRNVYYISLSIDKITSRGIVGSGTVHYDGSMDVTEKYIFIKCDTSGNRFRAHQRCELIGKGSGTTKYDGRDMPEYDEVQADGSKPVKALK